jgi:hypothetical protein
MRMFMPVMRVRSSICRSSKLFLLCAVLIMLFVNSAVIMSMSSWLLFRFFCFIFREQCRHHESEFLASLQVLLFYFLNSLQTRMQQLKVK